MPQENRPPDIPRTQKPWFLQNWFVAVVILLISIVSALFYQVHQTNKRWHSNDKSGFGPKIQ